MKKIYLICISIIILSCSSDDSNDTILPEELFIKQINENGLVSRKYTYQNNLISSREFYESGALWRKEFFEYTNDTVFIRSYNSSNELTQTRKYYTVTGNTSRRDRYNANNEFVNYRTYYFSDNTCGFVSIDFHDDDDTLTSTSTFNYTDSNCSMESTRYDSANEIISKEEWTRDDKNLFNKNELLDFFRGDNLGNTIIYHRWDSQNNMELEHSYESSFEYNNSNYPISENREYLNGTLKEITYEYY